MKSSPAVADDAIGVTVSSTVSKLSPVRLIWMTGAGNQEHAETVGLGLSIISAAQPWPKAPTHIEHFLELTFLVARRDEVQGTECC